LAPDRVFILGMVVPRRDARPDGGAAWWARSARW
jgi:hypothetical protein